jgi:hypothetical protein
MNTLTSMATSLGSSQKTESTQEKEKVDGALSIQLSTKDLTKSHSEQIQTKICEMIQTTLKEKIKGFEESLTVVANGIVKKVDETLQEKIQTQMLTVINHGFEQKLVQFYKEVNETVVNESLIDKIIFDIGLRLDNALIEKKDSGNVEIYEQHVKKKESEEGIPKTGGRKTKRNLMRKTKTKRNLMRKTKRSKV